MVVKRSKRRVLYMASDVVEIRKPAPANENSLISTDPATNTSILVEVGKLNGLANPQTFYAKFYPGVVTSDDDIPRAIPADAVELLENAQGYFEALVPVVPNINQRNSFQTLVAFPDRGLPTAKAFHVTDYLQFVELNFTKPDAVQEVNVDGTVPVRFTDPGDFTVRCYAKIYPGTIDAESIPQEKDPTAVLLSANSDSPRVFTGLIDALDVRLNVNINKTLVVWPFGDENEVIPYTLHVKHFAAKLKEGNSYADVALDARNSIWFAWTGLMTATPDMVPTIGKTPGSTPVAAISADSDDDAPAITPNGETDPANRPVRLVVPRGATRVRIENVNGNSQWEVSNGTQCNLDGTGSMGVGLSNSAYRSAALHSNKIAEDGTIKIGKLVGFWGVRRNIDAQEIPIGKGPINIDIPLNQPYPAFLFLGCHDTDNWAENGNVDYSVTVTVTWS